MDNHQLARGSLTITTGYIVFYLSSYVIHFGLSRIITPEEYGTVGVLLSILSILQIFLINGIPTAASKYLSEGIDGKEIKKKSLILQFILIAVMVLLIIILSPSLALLLNDRNLAPYILFLSPVIVIRGVNHLFNFFFNGYREFGKQTIHLTIDSFPRVILVFLFVALGYGVFGILGGYAAASLIGVAYAIFFFKPKKTKRSISYKKIISFSYPIIIYSVFFQVISSLDLFFIKASNISEDYVGFYTSARVLSTLFVILSAAFSLTLLPSISNSYSAGKKEETDLYIRNSLRYMLMIFIPVALIFSVNSKEFLSLFFGPEYGKASHALSILIWGWLFLQIFYVLSTIINASGKSKIPAWISGLSLLIAGIGNLYLVNRYGIEGGAAATLIAGVFCFVFGLYFIYRIFGVSIDIPSSLKMVCAAIAVYGISLVVKPKGVIVLGWSLILLCLYTSILIITKAINSDDLKLLRNLYKGFVNRGFFSEI